MKASEVRGLSVEELVKKEAELRENILRMKFKVSTGELEDISQIKKARKDIARIQTILSERRREEVSNGK